MVPFFTAMTIGVLGDSCDAPSAGDAVIAAAGWATAVDEAVVDEAVVDEAGVDEAAVEEAVEEEAVEEVADAGPVAPVAPADPGVDAAAAADVELPPVTATPVGTGVPAAPVGPPAVDPVVAGAALLLPSALEFEVQAAVASRVNDSSATVARRLQRVGWAAVRMLILEICAVKECAVKETVRGS